MKSTKTVPKKRRKSSHKLKYTHPKRTKTLHIQENTQGTLYVEPKIIKPKDDIMVDRAEKQFWAYDTKIIDSEKSKDFPPETDQPQAETLFTKHKIIIGDSREMREVPDESGHLIITSPPYWQLKDYGPAEQIGFNDTYEDYINNLNLVWKECYRVLHKGCRLCINIGDQFARSVYYGRYKIIPIRTEIIKFCETIFPNFQGKANTGNNSQKVY